MNGKFAMGLITIILVAVLVRNSSGSAAIMNAAGTSLSSFTSAAVGN